MKKPKLADYHRKNRLKRLDYIRRNHGLQIREMLLGGSTIGELITATGQPKKTLTYYLESENLLSKCESNWKQKRISLAKTNGKKSTDTLKGVQLKPITEEIRDWFLGQIKSGTFKWEVRTELQNKFGYGEKKYYQLCNQFGAPTTRPNTGKYNSMYGKSPSNKAGNGVKGWIFINGNKMFFRSSLELKIYLYLESNNITFVQSKHRVQYTHDGKQKTYLPDIVIGNTIYEIKPEAMTDINAVKIKFDALEKYCSNFGLKCGFITENTYPLIRLTKDYVDSLIEQKKLIVDQKNHSKLMRYL